MNFLVSGGGTGGHIFPALSIANEIKRRYPQAHILFVGAQGRMEMERVPAAGYPIKGLPVMGFDRKHLLRNVKVLYRVWKCTRMAKDIIKEFKPNVAIGVGGYASGPTLKEAQKMGVPTLLQEQNSYAVVMTGNPVRRNLLECTATPQQARQELGLDPDKKTILVIGGSLGARTVNESIIAGLQAIAGHDDVQVLWQSGKYYDQQCSQALAASGVTNVHQAAFVTRMDMAYRAADLVISRAGASSISELQLLGKPAILVPSPNVAEDHQTHNAMALVDKGAAIMVRDAEARDKLVATALDTVANAQTLQSLAANVKKMALANAAETIVDHVMAIAK